MVIRKIFTLIIIFHLSLFALPFQSWSMIKVDGLKTLSQEEVKIILKDQSHYFTENRGQWDPEILFAGETSFGNIFFTDDSISYNSITLSFVNPLMPTISGKDILPHYTNFFIGNNPKKWASGCSNYSKIYYANIWNGIDLAYFFSPEGLKYEYYVAPEANIGDLQMKVNGAELISHGTSLQMTTKQGDIIDADLIVYDTLTKQNIPSHFAVHNHILSFDGIPEKRDNVIVIDPLVYSTIIGGSDDDEATDIAIDSDKNIYVCGSTRSKNFPVTPSPYQGEKSAGYKEDGFIIKLNSDGNALVYSTYFGGSYYDYINGIQVDRENQIYITGGSDSTDFPITKGAYQDSNKGGADSFISKLDASGKILIYSTFIGGSDYEYAQAIDVDSDGNAYITGNCSSPDFPVSSDAYQKSLNWRSTDSFISKMNSTGSQLLYSSYFGGSSSEKGHKIEVNQKGIIFICGITSSWDLPVTPGAYQLAPSSNDSGWDCFITKLNINTSSLIYSTYLGGSLEDQAKGFSVDEDGNAFITGYTLSTDFPISKSACRIYNQDSDDVFITKLDPTGKTLLYSTYFGGSSGDFGIACCVDSEGYIYITGNTYSDDYPVIGENNSQKRIGSGDIFITKFDITKSDLPIDKTPPELTIVSPADNTEVEVSSVTITVEAYDKETGISSVTINGISAREDPYNKNRYFNQVNLKYLKNTIEMIATNRLGQKTTKKIIIIRKNPIILELWINKPEAFVDGQKTILEAPPTIMKNRTFVPVRFISEAFGAKVDWDHQEQKISIFYDNITINLWLTSSKVEKQTKTGDDIKIETFVLESPPFIYHDRTLIPIRFISESFGAQVHWDSKIQKVTIILRNNQDQGGAK